VPQFTPTPDTGQDRSTAFPWPSYYAPSRDFAPELQATPETADDDRLRLHHDLAWDYHQLGGYQHALHHGPDMGACTGGSRLWLRASD
jgi:hypothetical protein